MSGIREILRRPGYLALAALVAVVLFVVYFVLDLRAEGEGAGLLVFGNFMTPGMMYEVWGAMFYLSAIGLNLLIGVLLGLTVALSILRYSDRGAGAGATCSTASSVFIGLSAFT